MANVYLNNIYGNAAFCGAMEALVAERGYRSAVQADYAALVNVAAAIASQVDSKIAFDALVTTGAGITQLAQTTNTITANEQWRAGLLQALVRGWFWNRFPTFTTPSDYDTEALAIKEAWDEGLTELVTP